MRSINEQAAFYSEGYERIDKSRSVSPQHNRTVSYLDDMHASKGSQDFSALSNWAGQPRGPNYRIAEEPEEPYAHMHLIERLIDEEGEKTKPVVMNSPLNFSAISSAHSSVNHTPQLSKLNSP